MQSLNNTDANILPPHPRPADFDAFLATCTPAEKRLHDLATSFLGSSYFPEKTHGYKAWKAAKNANPKAK